MAQRVETIGGVTFISHEPIQMHSTNYVMVYFPAYFSSGTGTATCLEDRGRLTTDSIVVRSQKIASTRLVSGRRGGSFDWYYLAVLTSYPIWREFWPYSIRWNEDNRDINNCFGYLPPSPTGGCSCYVYRIIIDGNTITISSPEKFRELFAPVETVQEAIAFAHIFTRAFPIYNFNFLKAQYPDTLRHQFIEAGQGLGIYEDHLAIHIKYWEIHQPEIVSSFVEITDNGYKLLLYKRGTPSTPVLVSPYRKTTTPYWRKLIKVTFDGKVKVLESVLAFSMIDTMSEPPRRGASIIGGS